LRERIIHFLRFSSKFRSGIIRATFTGRHS
jgi:hypothetical protein